MSAYTHIHGAALGALAAKILEEISDELIDVVGFASINVRLEGQEFASVWSRNSDAEAEFQRLACDAPSRNLRQCVEFQAGLAPEVFGDNFFAGADSLETEQHGATNVAWGRVVIRKDSLPQTEAFSKYCYYICCDFSDSVVDCNATKTATGGRGVGAFQRKSYELRPSASTYYSATRDELGAEALAFSKDALAPSGCCDADGQKVTVEYALPFVIDGAYLGRVRIGLSRRLAVAEMSIFCNVFYKLVGRIVESVRSRQHSEEDYRYFLKQRERRLECIRRIVANETRNVFVPQRYKELVDATMENPIFQKFSSRLCHLELTIPRLRNNNGERVTFDYAVNAKAVDAVENFYNDYFVGEMSRFLLGRNATFCRGLDENIENESWFVSDPSKIAWSAAHQNCANVLCDAFNGQFPDVSARVVANEEGGERYLVATLNEVRAQQQNFALPPDSVELYGQYDATSHNPGPFEIPLSLSVWAFLRVFNLNITDALGRRPCVAIAAPILVGGVCYRLYAVFSGVREYEEYWTTDAGKIVKKLVNPRYFDDLIMCFRDVLTEFHTLKEFARLSTQEASIRKNYIGGHEENHLCARISENVQNLSMNVENLACRLSEIDKNAKEGIMSAWESRPTLPGGLQGRPWHERMNFYEKKEKGGNLSYLMETIDSQIDEILKTNDLILNVGCVRRAVARALEGSGNAAAFANFSEENTLQLTPFLKNLGFGVEEQDATWCVAPWLEADSGRKIRPADAFYRYIFKEFERNARKRGERVYARVEDVYGEPALIFANSTDNQSVEDMPENWVVVEKVQKARNNFAGGLMDARLTVIKTETGEIWVRKNKEKGTFEAALTLKGLKKEG